MIVYLFAIPIFSFALPLYSFWHMDDFSWGNTRVVIGEGNNKKVVIADDEKFDESMIPLKKFSGKSRSNHGCICLILTHRTSRIRSRDLGDGLASFRRDRLQLEVALSRAWF